MRAGQARRPGPNDGNLASAADVFAARIAQFGIDATEVELARFDAEFFTDEPFQRANGHGGVERAAPAFRFAWRGADAAADGGERVGRAGDDVVVVAVVEAARVLAEKTAGRSSAGTVDLIWINGANFAAMKRKEEVGLIDLLIYC